MPIGKVAVAVDSLKHTFLERRSTVTTPSPVVGGALISVPEGGASRQGQVSSSLLSKLSQEYNNVEQRRARSALTQIVRKSASPAVVRLYSAAIEEPGPLKSLKHKSKENRKLFTARPQAHVEAFRDSRKILALAAERGKLTPAVIPHRKATELVVDTRPKHVGVIPMFEKRILESGMPPLVQEEPLPYPANPYRASSPRNEPELVYSPAGVSELLSSCLPLLNRARAEGSLPTAQSRRGSRPPTATLDAGGVASEGLPVLGSDGRPITPLDATLGLIIPSAKGIYTRDGAITPTKRNSPPGSRPNSPDRGNSSGTGAGTEAAKSPRGSFHFKSILSSAMRQHTANLGSLTPAPSEAEELLKASHKSGVPPTRNTLSARKRLLQVKVHLNWKRATEDASNLVSEASISLSRQSLATTFGTGKDFRSGDAPVLGDKDLARGAFVAHRKGIVKDRFNK